MKTQAIVFCSPGEVSLKPVEIPDPNPDELLIETWSSCVSPGTEMRVLSGKQAGAPEFPLIPGYSAAGVVISGGERTAMPRGTKVFYSGTSRADIACCWGGHCGHAVVRESSVIALPDSLEPADACSAKLAAIARHGQKMVPMERGEKVVVFGLGPIGMYSALLFQEEGACVLGIDPSPARRHFAESLGLRTAEVGQPIFDGEGAQVVVDATGVLAVLASSVAALRDLPWGNHKNSARRLLLQGSYAGDIALPYAHLFDREVQIIVPRDNVASDVIEVLAMFAKGKLCGVAADFGGVDNAQAAYDSLRRSGELPLTGFFRWVKGK